MGSRPKVPTPSVQDLTRVSYTLKTILVAGQCFESQQRGMYASYVRYKQLYKKKEMTWCLLRFRNKMNLSEKIKNLGFAGAPLPTPFHFFCFSERLILFRNRNTFIFLRGFSFVLNFTRFFIFNFMTEENFRIFLFDCYFLWVYYPSLFYSYFYFYSYSYRFFLILLLSISPFLSYSLIELPTCSLLLDKLQLASIWFSSDNSFPFHFRSINNST